MKAILLGIIAIVSTAMMMVFVKDATAFIFFAPFGAGMIYLGIRYGDRCLDNDFWERRDRK